MWFGLAAKADKQIVLWLTNYKTLFGSWKCYSSVMSPVLNPADCVMKNNLSVSANTYPASLAVFTQDYYQVSCAWR